MRDFENLLSRKDLEDLKVFNKFFLVEY